MTFDQRCFDNYKLAKIYPDFIRTFSITFRLILLPNDRIIANFKQVRHYIRLQNDTLPFWEAYVSLLLGALATGVDVSAETRI